MPIPHEAHRQHMMGNRRANADQALGQTGTVARRAATIFLAVDDQYWLAIQTIRSADQG